MRVLCGYFEHQRRVQFEGCVAELLNTITAILPGSMWSCLLTQFYFPLKLRVFGGDITESFKGTKREVAEIAKKVMEKL